MIKGTHHTEKSREKMLWAGKRIKKPLTETHKQNIGKSLIGRKYKPITETGRKNISLAHKGLKMTLETIQKRRLTQLGSKSHLWKGGITPITSKIRSSIKYREWRQKVFIRDDFTCQKCGKRGGELHAHHKKEFYKIIQEIKQNLPLMDLYEAAMIYTVLWDIGNGETQCGKCHLKRKKDE
jgi:hypothetical protein